MKTLEQVREFLLKSISDYDEELKKIRAKYHTFPHEFEVLEYNKDECQQILDYIDSEAANE